MNDQQTQQLKYLRLKGLLAHWDDYLLLPQNSVDGLLTYFR